ncbi:MAG: urea ABC transporter permease subunit UrtB, partial [Lachnospiraceae bacterium]|nr:urea ABC transporter permease subunit UrtB [Lachnospiraceae bacterium]
MNLLFNGLSLSSIILLASLGLAITFGLMRVINMAHGEFMMIGAYTSYVVQNLLQTWLGKSGVDIGYFLSIIIAFAVTFLIGSFLETLVVSRLYG